MPDVRRIMAEKWEKWKVTAAEYRCIRRPCIIMFAVYVLGISAILRANFNYRDDFRRVFNGSKGWQSSGRYLSNILSSFVHADSYLTDVSPLPQLLAALLMAVSAYIVWYLLSREKKFTFWGMASLVSMGLSPYFLECFSYKYDAPYMALSVLVSVFPLLLWKRGRWVFFMASALGSLIMCLTYQASSGIFPMLVVLLCLKQWNCGQKNREIIKFAAYPAGGYLLGMIAYKLFIMPQKTSYVSTELPPLPEIIPMAAANFIKYIHYVERDFKLVWLCFMIILCLGFLFVLVRDAKRKWYAAFPVSVIAVLIMLALSFGAYTVFSKPLFKPRAVYGICVFFVFAGVVVSTAKKVYPLKLSCVLLAWCFFVFSFTYGNALREQQDYTQFRITAVINDLNSLDIMVGHGKKEMQLEGGIGYAPVVKNMVKHNQMIKSLVPIQFKSGWRTEEWRFFHYYGIKNIEWNWPKKSGKNFKDYNLPILKDTMYHTIRGKDGRVLVELK